MKNRFDINGMVTFPLPVFAAPKISRPASACGMAAAWISVGCVILADCKPASVLREMGIDSKVSDSELSSIQLLIKVGVSYSAVD